MRGDVEQGARPPESIPVACAADISFLNMLLLLLLPAEAAAAAC
jgi:hypothetical protein